MAYWCEDFLLDYIGEGTHAVNIGAHQGYWVKQLAGCYERVTAIEATPANVAVLNRLAIPNVTVVPKAAWMHVGTVEFHVRSQALMNCAVACRDIMGDQGVSQTITVDATTVDALNLSACDLIMMDTEGAEVMVAMGAARTIERFRPNLIIECHEIEHRNWLMTWLERAGYNLAILHEPQREMHDDWMRHVYLIGHHYRGKRSAVP